LYTSDPEPAVWMDAALIELLAAEPSTPIGEGCPVYPR
jgi:hypothetical protein